VVGECGVLDKCIILINYHAKLIAFIPPFGIRIFKKNPFKKCYNHLEIVICIFFYPTECKKLFKIVFCNPPKKSIPPLCMKLFAQN
jgi:hypothetical protein